MIRNSYSHTVRNSKAGLLLSGQTARDGDVMVIALAGRRVDAEDAQVPRFPPQHVETVEKRIATALKDMKA